MAKSKTSRIQHLRRSLALVSLSIVLLLLPLVLIRSCESRLRVDVIVRELSFDLADGATLVDAGPYERLYVIHDATAQVLRGNAPPTRLRSTPHGALSIENPFLTTLRVPSGARVSLARTDTNDLSLLVRGGRTFVQLSAPGQTITCDNCEVDGEPRPHYETTAVNATEIRLHSSGAPFHAILTRTGGNFLAEPLPIDKPAFITGSSENPMSSVIADGSVAFSEIKVDPLTVHKSDALHLRDPRAFTITTFEALPDREGLHVVMQGWARGVSIAGKDRQLSLLERLHANQPLSLYVTAVIFAIGVIVTILRTLRLVRGLT